MPSISRLTSYHLLQGHVKSETILSKYKYIKPHELKLKSPTKTDSLPECEKSSEESLQHTSHTCLISHFNPSLARGLSCTVYTVIIHPIIFMRHHITPHNVRDLASLPRLVGCWWMELHSVSFSGISAFWTKGRRLFPSVCAFLALSSTSFRPLLVTGASFCIVRTQAKTGKHTHKLESARISMSYTVGR